MAIVLQKRVRMQSQEEKFSSLLSLRRARESQADIVTAGSKADMDWMMREINKLGRSMSAVEDDDSD